jgi:RND family efflux transporter MFP subunit
MKILPLALLTGIASIACSTPASVTRNAEAPAINVAVARVERSTFPERFEGGGVVRARLTAPIASRILAPILEVRVRPGDRVAAGQVLVALDGRELQMQAERATAAVSAARNDVRAGDAEKLAATARLRLATASFDRVNGLHAKRSATTQELDEATASLDAARAASATAEARAAAAASALTATEAAAQAAKISASYALVTAPFAGRVTERLVDPGTTASPGTPLLSLEDDSLLKLEVSLDEARARGIAVGQQVAIRIGDASGDSWQQGRVSEIARLDPSSHSFLVKIDLPPALRVRSGSFGRARFEGGSRETLVVPESAVFRRGQLSFVFAVDVNGVARLRPISIGESTANQIEVLSGLNVGERVVDRPPAALKDGSSVKSGGTS